MSRLAAVCALSCALLAAAPVQAAVPPLGTPEGEMLCAGLMRTLVSGAMLSTGGAEEALLASRAYGVFIGRLSILAPEATARPDQFPAAVDGLSADERGGAFETCLRKAYEIDSRHVDQPHPKAP